MFWGLRDGQVTREGKPRWADGAIKPAGGSPPASPARPAPGGPAARPASRSPSPRGWSVAAREGAAVPELQPRGAGQEGGGKHQSLTGVRCRFLQP